MYIVLVMSHVMIEVVEKLSNVFKYSNVGLQICVDQMLLLPSLCSKTSIV